MQVRALAMPYRPVGCQHGSRRHWITRKTPRISITIQIERHAMAAQIQARRRPAGGMAMTTQFQAQRIEAEGMAVTEEGEDHLRMIMAGHQSPKRHLT